MLFLVDGYNVTRSDPATRDLALEEQRDALLRRLRSNPHLLGAGRIVVVFDAEQGFGGSSSEWSPLEVVFSRGASADDTIVRIAKSASGKLVVVSDDRELVERARAHARHGFETRQSSTCFAGAKGRRPKRRGGVARDSGLPPGAHAITRELKELWLGDEDSDE